MTEVNVEVASAEGWEITPGEYNTLQYRTFKAVPKERCVVDYHTFERYHNQVIDAVVPVEVVEGNIRFSWDERKGMWDTQIALKMFQLNPQTMTRYSYRNPKSAMLYTREESEIPVAEAIKAVLVEALLPKTRIVITEVPA